MNKAYKVGQRLIVRLSNGRIEEAAVVRAVIETTEGLKLQVDFGHDETALIHESQVIHD